MNVDTPFQNQKTLLQSKLRELQSIIETVPSGNISDWIMNIEIQAQELCTLLKQYFEKEEDGEFMSSVLEVNPNLSPTVDSLKEQHQTFLQELEDLMKKLDASDTIKPADLTELCKRFKTLIYSLHKHERDEIEVFQKVFSEDLGAGD